MAIVRWNPWTNTTIGQFLDDNYPFDMRWEEQIAVDVYETDNDVVVKAQMPGFTDRDIKITVEGSTLTLRGEIKEEAEENKKKYYRKEIRSQSFVRSITLPTPVSSENAKANFKDGILTLNLPKAEEAKPKEISISNE